jgi:Rps23 Pro-64 3,4-dihydroxylase Tpa1-like proline 4-hydroxylase
MFIEQENWKLLDQVREEHYGEFLKTDLEHFPDENEVYTAKFWRNEELESNENIEIIFKNHFIDMFNKLSESELTKFDIRCYKMDNGCHYRQHMDDWVGDIGCMYYFHKRWVWDWGGITHLGLEDDSDSVVPIFPKFNRAVFSNHKKYKFPHFVSHVTDYAKETRLSLISFGK